MKRIRLSHLVVIAFAIGLLFTVPTDGFAKWWDKFGEPKYGGTITIPTILDDVPFDPWSGKGYTPGLGFQFPCQGLFWWDWTLDRNIWPYQADFLPEQFMKGLLAESWELTDPNSFTVHLREGIYWQDKPPVNGREFVSSDVVEHYHRLAGTDGYTQPSMFAQAWLSTIEKVTAMDKYTVVFKLKQTVAGIFQVTDLAGQNTIEAQEAVTADGGTITNWKNCVGTGPWIITDFLGSSSVTYSRNPKYWGYDERHPKNQLPYADQVRLLHITDIATQEAALRTGKVDILSTTGSVGGLNWQQAETLAKTNPELKQFKTLTRGYALLMAVDTKPFTDIRVRKALQMTINRQEIAKNYYNGTVEGIPCGLVSPTYKGWCYPYNEWSQNLKDEYSYNLDQAKKLLSDAGYPNGFSTNVVTGSADDLQLLQVIQSYFKSIGVNMEIKTMDPAAVFLYCMSGKNDGFFYTYQTGVTWPPAIMITARMSTDPRNFTRSKDPVYDEIANRFFAAKSMDEAKQTLREADKYIIEQHWSLYLFPSYLYAAYQPYLKGYSGERIGYHQGAVWARVWIDQDMKK